MKVADRFLRYVSLETQSCEDNTSCPSTQGQRVLAQELVKEMRTMGIADAEMDEYGYVYGTVPGSADKPVIGLIAHMDTAPDCSGSNIRPRVLLYEGGDIVLNEEKNTVMKCTDFPSLASNVGKHLIVTDGTTLLGADDKAGIAEILTCAERLLASDLPHATLRIGFTPDEEIGRGADLFNLKSFGAQYAYTCDGGTLGEIEYENFNAASARVHISGINIHPGDAKNKMVNSMQLAMEFHAMLPVHERPECTENYEGFSHLCEMRGDVEATELAYIIRDHDMDKFLAKKARFTAIADYLNDKYGAGTVALTLKDSYYNMKEKILPVMHIIDRARAAYRAAGITPVDKPVRGGTDGARLSFEGLPCPNLCTGGENYHGRFEYIPIEDMDRCVDMLVALMQA